MKNPPKNSKHAERVAKEKGKNQFYHYLHAWYFWVVDFEYFWDPLDQNY